MYKKSGLCNTGSMPKKIDFTLTQADLQIVVQAIKSDKRPEVRQRAMGIRLLHEGQSPQEIARLMSVSQPTVYSWHHRWCGNKLEGLANRPKSGRPRKADEAYVALLETVIEQDPQELGYEFTVWTANRLRLHLEKETGVALGATQFHALLKENDFVYRRPKHDLTDLQDADARAAATEWLDALKKKQKPARSTFSLWTKAV
jgi:putative transposase